MNRGILLFLVFGLTLARAEPRLAIVSPSDNSIVDAGDIYIAAAASNAVGSISSIQFYQAETWIGESRTNPFGIFWNSVPPGQYAVTARAMDINGQSYTSAPVRIDARAPLDAALVRGPYLQMATPRSIVIRWRTDQPTGSRVVYGRGPDALTQVAQSSRRTTEHEIKLSNLLPNTRYYYGVATPAKVLESGFYNYFTTGPLMEKPTRVWVIGDSGTASADARSVWQAYEAFTGSIKTDVWLMLGDNAYGSGTDAEYQRAVFNMYPDILRQTPVWPTLGNHDASPAYYDIFTLPIKGEAGGIASGTEHYYSFDYGNIHFVCMDSSHSRRGSNDVMCTWLRADLAANTKEWVIAYWHHPPYSHGSHNSDFEGELIQMRENVLPILDDNGVDLVLCGHSHCYERSFLLRGHYGRSETLQPSMILNNTSGRYEDAGPYLKATKGTNAEQGIVYVVAGSSGWATFGSLDHPVMYTSYLTMGSLILDIDGPSLNATFLTKDGTVDDYFSILKDASELRLTAIQLVPGQVILRWNSVPGSRYVIEFAPEASPTAWSQLSGAIGVITHRTTWIHYGAPNLRAGFYRVRQLE